MAPDNMYFYYGKAGVSCARIPPRYSLNMQPSRRKLCAFVAAGLPSEYRGIPVNLRAADAGL